MCHESHSSKSVMITTMSIPIKTAKPCGCMLYLTELDRHTEEPKLGKICQQS